MNAALLQRVISIAIGALVAVALIYGTTIMFSQSQQASSVQSPAPTAADR